MSEQPDNAYTRTWAPDLRSAFVTLPDGTKVRHIVTGTGPDLLLLHTIRTQLDLFQRLVPLLASRYTVHAIDYPGFGWSDIVRGADYDEPTQRRQVIDVIDALALVDGLHLVGESIGGALALTIASQLGPRIRSVTAINTYDYVPGIERASPFAAFIVKGVKAPVVGPVFAALENRTIVARIMRAGVSDPNAMPDHFINELARVGKRAGYSRVARAVFRSLPSYVAARKLYPTIESPVTLVYGNQDWSRPPDRETTRSLVPAARLVMLEHAGHFASLEQPERLAGIIAGTN